MRPLFDRKPRKNDYRKFKIRTVEGTDDFASMREVVERHYSRLLEAHDVLPDLIVIDGGVGQYHAALAVLQKIKIPNGGKKIRTSIVS